MTSRMHAPHTTCPGCQEEVFLDELVGGKCPLCGCSLEDFEESIGEYDGILDRSDLSWLIFNYFVFKKFVNLGVSPRKSWNLSQITSRMQTSPRKSGQKRSFPLNSQWGSLTGSGPSDAQNATRSLCGEVENRLPVTCAIRQFVSSTCVTSAEKKSLKKIFFISFSIFYSEFFSVLLHPNQWIQSVCRRNTAPGALVAHLLISAMIPA